jgi:hypothetical protein
MSMLRNTLALDRLNYERIHMPENFAQANEVCPIEEAWAKYQEVLAGHRAKALEGRAEFAHLFQVVMWNDDPHMGAEDCQIFN